ncbi:hypothetical protein J1605_019467 [Eschrichtius robustus]|uniref:Uncharacterized protein n=1 Tax=Eschrichtius robustus TaxID=9764 RepID=A0AB34HL37_ESCRO|nr:hypothetical protein J1605_019467 [Eschrichtius robustus]
MCKSRIEASEETNPADALISDLQPPELRNRGSQTSVNLSQFAQLELSLSSCPRLPDGPLAQRYQQIADS